MLFFRATSFIVRVIIVVIVVVDFTIVHDTTTTTNIMSTSKAGRIARGGSSSLLPDDVLAELRETAKFLCQPGKGFLASDESAGPWGRCGHAEAKKIPDTIEARAAYRSMIYRTPGLSEYVDAFRCRARTTQNTEPAETHT